MSSIALAIDTSKQTITIALIQDTQILGSQSWEHDRHTGEKIVRAIEDLLQQHAYSLQDVSRIAVHRGPGGYSSLRAGVVTAEHLALANDIPLVEFSTNTIDELVETVWNSNLVDHIDVHYPKTVQK